MEPSKKGPVSNTLVFSLIALSFALCFVALVHVEIELHAHRKMLQVLTHQREENVHSLGLLWTINWLLLYCLVSLVKVSVFSSVLFLFIWKFSRRFENSVSDCIICIATEVVRQRIKHSTNMHNKIINTVLLVAVENSKVKCSFIIFRGDYT